MKSIKLISFILLAIAISMSSCSMEKQVYTSGYHIDWNKSKQNTDRQELVSKDNPKQADLNQIGKIEQSENVINTVDNSSKQPADNITASISNQQIILPQKEQINLLSSHKVKTIDEEKQNKTSFVFGFNKGAEMVLTNDEEPKRHPLALKGFIVGLTGVLLSFLGIILGPISIILSIIALVKINKDKTKWKGKRLAIAGIILGFLSFIFFFVALASMFSHV